MIHLGILDVTKGICFSFILFLYYYDLLNIINIPNYYKYIRREILINPSLWLIKRYYFVASLPYSYYKLRLVELTLAKTSKVLMYSKST